MTFLKDIYSLWLGWMLVLASILLGSVLFLFAYNEWVFMFNF